MMINNNGVFVPSKNNELYNNRAFLYGDGVFETLKIVNGKILFLESHYFRLMSAMRIVRMEIPNYFTLEYIEDQILTLANKNKIAQVCRAKFIVYRKTGGFYDPKNNDVNFIITVTALKNAMYQIDKKNYEVDLYKDFYISSQLLSTIKSTNRIINIVGSIFAKENNLENCLLLNEHKNIVEALQGNIFMVTGNVLKTPPSTEGCLNGIMRKQILDLAKKKNNLTVLEASISPFELQKADELFITNVIIGIQPITKYRKKEYQKIQSHELLNDLNTLIGF